MQVILGTGPIGFSVMKELVMKGQQVKMVNTSGKAAVPSGVEVVKADLYDKEQVQAVTSGSDTVYQCTSPLYWKWEELFMKLQDSILEGVSKIGAKLVMADNMYMYGEVQGPIHEQLPYLATTKKGKIRKQSAEKLLEAHKRGQIRAALVRGADFFGPRALNSVVGERFFQPIVSGKPCTFLGNPEMPHTFTYVEDFGKSMVTVAGHEDAFGQAWHVPNAATVKSREFAEIAYRYAGFPPKVKTMSRGMVRFGGLFNPLAREAVEMLYQFEKPFVVDSTKFTSRFGLQATPTEEAVRTTVEWYKQVR